MGIPKFFRWLTRRYPLILQNVTNYDELPLVDNFYLDLNGIVHNCIHGNDPKRHERISKLQDLEEVWSSVMQAIDELVHTMKPKKVLLLAVDGVAPRAKMNQQRARRFRSAKEAIDLKNKLNSQGKNVPDLFDSNAISPGTDFMMELCNQLHFFVKYKVSTDPLYQNLEIVLTDGMVPGEGEHKMLDYIRQLRLKPTYDPNTRHCFYGADADLIMLSLLTHEPHFTIIREEHVIRKQKNGGVSRVELSKTSNFQVLYVTLLREYMMLEYRSLAGKMKIKFDLERIIDDFVFFCFFIGNDFLPSLSALSISEGSLDKLIDFYQKCLPQMTDYITESGTIHWDRAEPFIWLLSEHENDVFKNRIDEIEGRRRQGQPRTVHVTQEQSQMRELQGKSQVTHNAYKEKIFQKKKAKVEKLKIDNRTKFYKKFLYSKIFKEDDQNQPKFKKTARANLLAKLKSKVEGEYEPLELIKMIDDENISDLCPEDIPDDCVSEIETTLETLESAAVDNGVDDGNAELKAEEDNLQFMTTFVKKYAENADVAKQYYYQTKVQFDISTSEGMIQRKKMLKKYLEGTQWVLYYYYKGSPHWRWYYPYHYAPMISDLGINIVKDFLGTTSITTFEIDYNCPVNTMPFTPFQQLLCIMPIRSFKLLPQEYREIPSHMDEQFPTDFGLDINGKTNLWEAIVLIPFVDEVQILKEEQILFDKGLKLKDSDRIRNSVAFEYFQYKYNPNAEPKLLKSTLTSFTQKIMEKCSVQIVREYENVGSQAFEPRLLPNIKHPSPGYPSFKYLNVQTLEPDYKFVQKVSFTAQLVVMPQCIEESQPEEFKKFIKKLETSTNKECFVGFPFQNEAFAMYFEDKFTIYTLTGDVQNDKFQIYTDKQFRTPEQWNQFVNRTCINLAQFGIFCPNSQVNVIVTCNRVENVEFDQNTGSFYKTYKESPDVVPLSLIMRKRDVSHPLNCLNIRTSESNEREFKRNDLAICLNLDKFGLVGKIDKVDFRKQQILVQFDKQHEQSKVHDPFMGQKLLKNLLEQKDEAYYKTQLFFGDQDIEKQLLLKPGVISRITSSFLISYRNPDDGEKMIVDLGLNIKNFTKKLHVPSFVRFVQNTNDTAMNQNDNYNHNSFARGSNHVRSHWEYSFECVQFIKEYLTQFPEVFEAVKKCGSKGPAVNKLKDLYGSEDQNSISKIRQILTWIESLPISQLPYVEMGFDALDPRLIKSLNDHRQDIQDNFQNVDLTLKDVESFKPSMIFVERFPYWSSPFGQRSSKEFKVGDRVQNINSVNRQYVPFGLRGTVIGRTDDKVMVMFDQQFTGGDNLFNQCENYRGALINPNYLNNLTRKFQSAINKKGTNTDQILYMFTERQGPEEEMKTQVVQEKKSDKTKQAQPTKMVYKPKSQVENVNEKLIPQVNFVPIPATLSNDFKDLLKVMEITQEQQSLNLNATPFEEEKK